MLWLYMLSAHIATVHCQSTLYRQARRCCPSLRVSSPSLAGDAQADKMGLYRRVGAMNGRHVYRHVARHVYIYYYDWDGRGTNWMLGPEAGGQSRGVQSVNLQGRALGAQWCPEDLHQARVMRVQCSCQSEYQLCSVSLGSLQHQGAVGGRHEAAGRVF